MFLSQSPLPLGIYFILFLLFLSIFSTVSSTPTGLLDLTPLNNINNWPNGNDFPQLPLQYYTVSGYAYDTSQATPLLVDIYFDSIFYQTVKADQNRYVNGKLTNYGFWFSVNEGQFSSGLGIYGAFVLSSGCHTATAWARSVNVRKGDFTNGVQLIGLGNAKSYQICIGQQGVTPFPNPNNDPNQGSFVLPSFNSDIFVRILGSMGASIVGLHDTNQIAEYAEYIRGDQFGALFQTAFWQINVTDSQYPYPQEDVINLINPTQGGGGGGSGYNGAYIGYIGEDFSDSDPNEFIEWTTINGVQTLHFKSKYQNYNNGNPVNIPQGENLINGQYYTNEQLWDTNYYLEQWLSFLPNAYGEAPVLRMLSVIEYTGPEESTLNTNPALSLIAQLPVNFLHTGFFPLHGILADDTTGNLCPSDTPANTQISFPSNSTWIGVINDQTDRGMASVSRQYTLQEIQRGNPNGHPFSSGCPGVLDNYGGVVYAISPSNLSTSGTFSEGVYEQMKGQTLLFGLPSSGATFSQVTYHPIGNTKQITDAIASLYAQPSSFYDYSNTDWPVMVNWCAFNPCANGGTCTSSTSGPKCECQGGWTGATCNNGATYTFEGYINGISCNGDSCTSNGWACANGVTGPIDVVVYVGNTYQKGGIFTIQAVANNGLAGYCQGQNDQSNTVFSFNWPSSIITEYPNAQIYVQPFYNGVVGPILGYNNLITLYIPLAPNSFCYPNPCLNGGKCVNGIGGFVCECENGYMGSICHTYNITGAIEGYSNNLLSGWVCMYSQSMSMEIDIWGGGGFGSDYGNFFGTFTASQSSSAYISLTTPSCGTTGTSYGFSIPINATFLLVNDQSYWFAYGRYPGAFFHYQLVNSGPAGFTMKNGLSPSQYFNINSNSYNPCLNGGTVTPGNVYDPSHNKPAVCTCPFPFNGTACQDFPFRSALTGRKGLTYYGVACVIGGSSLTVPSLVVVSMNGIQITSVSPNSAVTLSGAFTESFASSFLVSLCGSHASPSSSIGFSVTIPNSDWQTALANGWEFEFSLGPTLNYYPQVNLNNPLGISLFVPCLLNSQCNGGVCSPNGDYCICPPALTGSFCQEPNIQGMITSASYTNGNSNLIQFVEGFACALPGSTVWASISFGSINATLFPLGNIPITSFTCLSNDTFFSSITYDGLALLDSEIAVPISNVADISYCQSINKQWTAYYFLFNFPLASLMQIGTYSYVMPIYITINGVMSLTPTLPTSGSSNFDNNVNSNSLGYSPSLNQFHQGSTWMPTNASLCAPIAFSVRGLQGSNTAIGAGYPQRLGVSFLTVLFSQQDFTISIGGFEVFSLIDNFTPTHPINSLFCPIGSVSFFTVQGDGNLVMYCPSNGGIENVPVWSISSFISQKTWGGNGTVQVTPFPPYFSIGQQGQSSCTNYLSGLALPSRVVYFSTSPPASYGPFTSLNKMVLHPGHSVSLIGNVQILCTWAQNTLSLSVSSPTILLSSFFEISVSYTAGTCTPNSQCAISFDGSGCLTFSDDNGNVVQRVGPGNCAVITHQTAILLFESSPPYLSIHSSIVSPSSLLWVPTWMSVYNASTDPAPYLYSTLPPPVTFEFVNPTVVPTIIDGLNIYGFACVDRFPLITSVSLLVDESPNSLIPEWTTIATMEANLPVVEIYTLQGHALNISAVVRSSCGLPSSGPIPNVGFAFKIPASFLHSYAGQQISIQYLSLQTNELSDSDNLFNLELRVPYCVTNGNCNNHGTCLPDGVCECNSGWFGSQCVETKLSGSVVTTNFSTVNHVAMATVSGFICGVKSLPTPPVALLTIGGFNLSGVLDQSAVQINGIFNATATSWIQSDFLSTILTTRDTDKQSVGSLFCSPLSLVSYSWNFTLPVATITHSASVWVGSPFCVWGVLDGSFYANQPLFGSCAGDLVSANAYSSAWTTFHTTFYSRVSYLDNPSNVYPKFPITSPSLLITMKNNFYTGLPFTLNVTQMSMTNYGGILNIFSNGFLVWSSVNLNNFPYSFPRLDSCPVGSKCQLNTNRIISESIQTLYDFASAIGENVGGPQPASFLLSCRPPYLSVVNTSSAAVIYSYQPDSIIYFASNAPLWYVNGQNSLLPSFEFSLHLGSNMMLSQGVTVVFGNMGILQVVSDTDGIVVDSSQLGVSPTSTCHTIRCSVSFSPNGCLSFVDSNGNSFGTLGPCVTQTTQQQIFLTYSSAPFLAIYSNFSSTFEVLWYPPAYQSGVINGDLYDDGNNGGDDNEGDGQTDSSAILSNDSIILAIVVTGTFVVVGLVALVVYCRRNKGTDQKTQIKEKSSPSFLPMSLQQSAVFRMGEVPETMTKSFVDVMRNSTVSMCKPKGIGFGETQSGQFHESYEGQQQEGQKNFNETEFIVADVRASTTAHSVSIGTSATANARMSILMMSPIHSPQLSAGNPEWMDSLRKESARNNEINVREAEGEGEIQH